MSIKEQQDSVKDSEAPETVTEHVRPQRTTRMPEKYKDYKEVQTQVDFRLMI